jgi:hypothetical protein
MKSALIVVSAATGAALAKPTTVKANVSDERSIEGI